MTAERERSSAKEIKMEVDKVCVVVVVVVVEGTKGAEAWQTAKRIKYRSTTKAVSQGRLSHKSPTSPPAAVPLTSCYHDSALPQRRPLI